MASLVMLGASGSLQFGEVAALAVDRVDFLAQIGSTTDLRGARRVTGNKGRFPLVKLTVWSQPGSEGHSQEGRMPDTSFVRSKSMIDRSREDPLVGYHYQLEVQSRVHGFFAEAKGMGSGSNVTKSKVVNEKGVEVVLKLPGRLEWGDIVLQRGITSDMSVWAWRKMVEDGDMLGARSNGSIVMFDQQLTEVARWNFENAWPSKVEVTESDGTVVEELTMAVEFIERAN